MDKVFIIAEAGVNHNGDLNTALKLVEVAANAGADAVKFQTFKAENLASRFAPKAKYQKKSTNPNESQFNMLKALELDYHAHKRLMAHCKDMKIEFLSTPFDPESVSLLHKLGLTIFKIPSGEITNLPYLKKIGNLNKHVIMSTGMADLGEIEDALDVLTKAGTPKNNIKILHCNTEYPTPYEDVNLRAMLTIRDAFKVDVGYSDHTPGIEMPIAAVALGAVIIEKHFTLDRNMKGPDHRASLEPHELNNMIKAIRNIEKALGDGIKKVSPSEAKNIAIGRKSIMALKNINKGEFFTRHNVTAKRPGNGISPMEWYRVIGKKASKSFSQGELITI